MKVLVVDDDIDLVDLLTYALRRAGYAVVSALDGEQALRSWQVERPDLVLLDGMLPRLDGFEVCRRIRQQGRTPIILLMERSAEVDVVGGLEAGADDYVPKPFSPKQLLARMQAVLRRYEPEPEQLAPLELRVGDLVLDPEGNQVTMAGQPIALTRMEFRLLYHLALNAGQIIPYSRLIETTWGYYGEGSAEVLKYHVTHLRKKLGLARDGPVSIKAVVGIGYSLTKPSP